MATITCGIAGSSLVPDNSKNYTITDAHLQDVIDWGKVAYAEVIQKRFNAANNPEFVPTNTQVLVVWFDQWMAGTTDSVQRHFATVTIPPPISIA